MKTCVKRISLLALLIFCAQWLAANDYEEYAKKVREEVWAWDRPEFKDYTVPEEYKGESAVILAKHDQILATGKSRFRVNLSLAFTINKELLYTSTERELVKINDKVSLEKYSSLSFKEQAKSYGYMMTSKFKTIVGARIIKADGTIKEVDVETESVDMTEGKRDRVDHKKLAIADLQVGDILDWFVQREGHMDTQNISPLNFVFGGEYPILSYSIYCEIGRKLTVEYLAVNGAPDFKISENEEKDVVMETEKKNIPKLEGYSRWVSAFREFPMIRMSILNNASGSIWKPKTARKSGLHKNLPSSTILDDAKCAYGGYTVIMIPGVKETKKMVDQYQREHTGVSKEDLAAYIYDALQYHWRYDGSYNHPHPFIESLTFLLKSYKIEHKLAFVTSRYGAPMDALANRYDVYVCCLANDNRQLFSYNPPFQTSGEIDPDFEGETAVTFSNYKLKGGMVQGTEGQFAVPVSDAKNNYSLTEMKIGFTDDPLVVDIHRREVYKGSLKGSFQRTFSTTEKWQEELRAHLNIKKSVLEEMDEKRSSRKYMEDYRAMVEKEQDELKDRFKENVTHYHDAEPRKLIDYQVEHLGVTPSAPDFITNVHYEQEGLVQKAGNNYILNVGKLIGSQLSLQGEDRKRNVDVYMPTARTYEHTIEINIPEGYVVENIESLNRTVDNEAGTFTSSAVCEGQVLKVTTQKIYKHAFEPLANWTKLLEMLDAATDYYGQSAIMRTKN